MEDLKLVWIMKLLEGGGLRGEGGGGVTGSDVNSVLVTVPVDFLNKNSICQSIPVYRFGATIIFVYSVFVCV